MKLLITRFSVIFALLLFMGCNEEDLVITDSQNFELVAPEASNINLNFAFPDNPAFTLAWIDNLTNSSNYSVDMATDGDFTTPVALGTSSTNTFTMSVANFNNALIMAGINAYENASIFMRVSSGGMFSNSVVFSVNSYPETPPVITSPSSGSTISISDATPDETALTIGWDDPDFNAATTQATINYDIESALAGTEFVSMASVGTTVDILSIDISHADINGAALTAGIVPDEVGSLDMRIKATIATASGNLVRYSESISLSVTPYSTSLGLSTWGVIGSGYNDWGNGGPDGVFYTTDQPDVIVTYLTLLDGAIKFRENNDWGNNLGDNGADGTLEPGGADIIVTAGTYRITINLNNNTYSLEEYSLGIVGSGFNDWGNAGPDAKMYYDYTTNSFKRGVKLLDGEIKFRVNNDWGVNYGGSGGIISGDNIAVTAGYYTVTIDLNNNTYSVVADDILGIIGSGFNDWGNAGPDFSLTEVNPDVWVGDIVTFVDGAIKFRVNEDWGTNYGGTGGALSLNGADINVIAGLYRIRVDLANNSYQANKVQ